MSYSRSSPVIVYLFIYLFIYIVLRLSVPKDDMQCFDFIACVLYSTMHTILCAIKPFNNNRMMYSGKLRSVWGNHFKPLDSEIH